MDSHLDLLVTVVACVSYGQGRALQIPIAHAQRYRDDELCRGCTAARAPCDAHAAELARQAAAAVTT